MNKKYELIADGANKRIKALRSFKVQDRYVNIGDVGGIVYDEKTLSQDDNAVYANGEVAEITDLEMRDNAHYEGMPLESIISLTMYDNSKCYGTVDLLNGSLFMMGNAEISADATVDAVGSLVMKDNAIVDSTLNTSGRIVLQGGYNQATQKTWKGCRNIDSENAPVYGGNVKTRHDYF